MTDDRVELLDRASCHRGFFGLDRLTLRHRRFDGTWSDPLVREVFLQPRAAAILPYDPVADRVVLIEQFRSGVWAGGGGGWMTEIVAGIIEAGETAEAVARREAAEEAGVEIGALERIAAYAPSPGATTEWVDVFVGRVSAPTEDGTFGVPGEGEDIRAFVLDAEAAVALLDGGAIENAVTLVALGWFARHRAALRRRWTGAAGDPG